MTEEKDIPQIGSKCLVRASYPNDQQVSSIYIGETSIHGEKRYHFASEEENRRYVLFNGQWMAQVRGEYMHVLLAPENVDWETVENLRKRFNTDTAPGLIKMLNAEEVKK